MGFSQVFININIVLFHCSGAIYWTVEVKVGLLNIKKLSRSIPSRYFGYFPCPYIKLRISTTERFTPKKQGYKLWGPTEIWTRIAGFKVQSANHYTMGPNPWLYSSNNSIELYLTFLNLFFLQFLKLAIEPAKNNFKERNNKFWKPRAQSFIHFLLCLGS